MTPGEQAIVSLLEDQKRARRRALLLKVLGITAGGVGAAYYGPKMVHWAKPIIDSVGQLPNTLSTVQNTAQKVNTTTDNLNGITTDLSRTMDAVRDAASQTEDAASGGIFRWMRGHRSTAEG